MWPFKPKRVRPTTEPVDENAYVRRLQALEVEVLEAGGGTLYPETNIAPGTIGYAICSLEFRGWLKASRTFERYGPISSGFVYRYTLTKEGRTAQTMMRDELPVTA